MESDFNPSGMAERLQERLIHLPEDFARVHTSMEALQSSVDMLRSDLHEEIEAGNRALEAIENRVRVLEQYRFLLMGAIAVAVAIGSFSAELLAHSMHFI